MGALARFSSCRLVKHKKILMKFIGMQKSKIHSADVGLSNIIESKENYLDSR